MAGQVNRITARTGHSEYEILIGNEILSDLCENELVQSADRIGVVVSSHVYGFHKDYIENSLQSLKSYKLYQMDDGEENKNYSLAEEYLEKFIKDGFTRNSVIIGIGGGVVGDFSGYLAAVYMRGLPVIHVPTTLLSMVDSSIGGKVAVNLSIGKNIVGAFHQPSMVISDVRFLNTLPDNELINGIVEALKHGLIGDDDSLRIIEENDINSIRDADVMTRVITLSAAFKSSVVEKDEKEGGLRAILNYGHTVGHAIESLMEYRGISHGMAVALGIIAALEISKRNKMLSEGEVSRVLAVIEKYSIKRRGLALNADDLISHMKYDKKNTGGNINFVLLDGIGNPKIKQKVDMDLLKNVLAEMFKN